MFSRCRAADLRNILAGGLSSTVAVVDRVHDRSEENPVLPLWPPTWRRSFQNIAINSDEVDDRFAIVPQDQSMLCILEHIKNINFPSGVYTGQGD